MSTKKPRTHEQLSADIERWQLEMASELGMITEVRKDSHPTGPRPLLRSHHFHKPQDKVSGPAKTPPVTS